jgi:hypothetical protein
LTGNHIAGSAGSLALPVISKSERGIFMETKNIIINNYARSLIDAANAFSMTAANLGTNADENAATIATLNVLLDSVRAQTVLTQRALDEYSAGV